MFTTLFLVEGSLQLLSRLMEDVYFEEPVIAKEDQKAIRVLVLGESTTDPQFARLQGAIPWPEQMQSILNSYALDHSDKAQKFVVYNLGRSSVHSYYFASHIDRWLTQYKPQVVIAMIGVNDRHYHSSFNPEQKKPLKPWYRKFKLVELFDWYNAFYKIDLKEFHFGEEKEKISNQLFEKVENKLINRLEEIIIYFKDHHFSEDEIHFALVQLSYRFMVNSTLQPRPVYLTEEIMSYLDQKKYYSRELDRVKFYYWSQFRKEDTCFDYVKFLVKEQNRKFSETEMNLVLGCVSPHLGRVEEWKSLLASQESFTAINENLNATVNNLTYISDRVANQKAFLVMMQYPVRPLTPLKDYFLSKHLKNITFVDNEMNFKRAIKDNGSDKIFTDLFAGDFGHMTTLGHSILAQQAAVGVLEALATENKIDDKNNLGSEDFLRIQKLILPQKQTQ